VEEIPQPPVVLSLCALGALLVAGAATLLYLQVPEYSSGSVIVGPRQALHLAVTVELARRLRPGQVVLVSSAAAALPRATVVGSRETMSRARAGASLHLDPVRLPRGARLMIARLELRGAATAEMLGPVGAVLPARVEVGRTSVLSRLPVVGRLT
jgi:hypothetical protein